MSFNYPCSLEESQLLRGSLGTLDLDSIKDGVLHNDVEVDELSLFEMTWADK